MTTDPTQLLAQVAWETIVKNVRMMTYRTYCITVSPENLNNVGAGIKEVGFYFIDNNGNQYSVTAINVNGIETDIEVTDDFNCGLGPVTDRTGIVYEAIGDSRYLAQVMYSRLDYTAQDKGRAIDLAVLWDELKKNEQSSDYGLVEAADGMRVLFSTIKAFRPGSTRVFVNGLRQYRGVDADYVEDAGKIKLAIAPLSYDLLICDYILQP